MNTEEVIPAKQVIDAALTFQGKAERGTLLGNQKKDSQIFENTSTKLYICILKQTSTISTANGSSSKIFCPP